MNRLTTILDDGNYIPTATCTISRDGKVDDIDGCKEYCDSCNGDCFGCAIQKCFDKLGEYEDAEEQGLLLRLPCKVGDTVYIELASYFDIGTYTTKYAEADVRDFIHFTSCGFCVVVTSKVFGKLTIPFSDFGKTVFLTKAEAEQRLKEMSKHDGE